jgi:hypothetical protein
LSVCENSGIFVGRGLSHDINHPESERLWPLKFRFAVLIQALLP